MASAYSTPKQFDNYVKPVNLELVNFVLGSKEQKFNYNIAKVEQTLQDFGQLGLVRDKDKEYLADRVNTMLTQMGDITNADWSDSNIERQISSGIRGSIDEKVRGDIQKSRSYTSYMKNVQAAKERNDGSYNDINFAMGLKNAGADKWVNGESDEMGNLNYTPYVDYTTKMNEIIKDRIKTHGTKEVESISNGDGTTTNITREVLRPETIRTLWQANMTPEMQNQIKMEADYKYGEQGEQVKAQVISSYRDNVVKEQSQTKQSLDIYNAALKATSDTDKRALIQEQIGYLNQSNEKLKQELTQGVSYQEAYLNSYFKNTRENIVEANAFDRKTDVELNYDALKVLKLKRDILKSDKTEVELAAESYSKVADPTITKDMAAVTVFERTEQGMKSSVEDFVVSMSQNGNFEQSYGLKLEDFNSKTTEQKIEFASEVMERISSDGIDMGTDSVYTTQEINAVSKYRSNKSVFDQVNTDIRTTTDSISKKSYDAMSNGVANNSINVGNIRIPAIKEAITSGKKFNELDPDQQNAFRVAMIDEAIRRADVGDGIKPYLLTQREELLKGIKSDKIKSQFSTSELLLNTRGSLGANIRAGLNKTEGGLNYLAESLGGLLNLDTIFGEQDRSSASFKEGEKYSKEATQRGSTLSLFQNDEGIKEFQGDEFIIDGKPTSSLSYIKNQYRGVTESAELTALESAPNLTSTSALIINPNIKGQKDVFNRASNYLASSNGASVADFKSSEMYMRVNPENNTVTFSAKLSRSAAKDYSGGDLPENRIINSDPIPVDQIGDMDAIMSRIKTDQDEWSLNSANKYAQNLKFKTSGFESTEQRKKIADAMMSKLPSDYALGLSQEPQSLGLTFTEMETYAEDATRTTKQGETKSLQQEFPNAYNSIMTGKGKFEVNYKSKHNQGYFMDVAYVIDGKTVPVVNNAYTGDTTLNPDQAYLEAFQAQTDTFLNIIKGYSQGSPKFINILKEIDKING